MTAHYRFILDISVVETFSEGVKGVYGANEGHPPIDTPNYSR